MKRLLVIVLAVGVVAGGAVWMTMGQDDAAETVSATNVPAASPAAGQTTSNQAQAPAEQTQAAAPAATSSAAAPSAERIELAQADVNLDSVTALGYVANRHYRRLSPTQLTTSSPGQVEVTEFFMYSCIHCYNLEPYLEEWLETKPDHITFVRVPTTWDAPRQFHAQAFYAAEALGKLEEMHTPFFREMHVAGNFLTTPDAMAEFFGRFGVSRSDYESAMGSFSTNVKVQQADELGNRYRIDSTPSIIINGKYRTDVSSAGGYEQMFELIEALAAAELGL